MEIKGLASSYFEFECRTKYSSLIVTRGRIQNAYSGEASKPFVILPHEEAYKFSTVNPRKILYLGGLGGGPQKIPITNPFRLIRDFLDTSGLYF